MISYIRIESRLIHGQTTTVLQRYFKCDGIIVIDEKVANGANLKNIYKLATPQGIKSYFFGLDKGIEQMRKAETSQYNYFIIFRDPSVVKEVIKRGYEFKNTITCGQQFIREDTIQVMQGCGLNKEEIEAFDFIASSGYEVVFDPSCKLENKSWDEVKMGITQ